MILTIMQYVSQALILVFVLVVLYDYLKGRKNDADTYDIDSLCDYLSQSDEDGKEE